MAHTKAQKAAKGNKDSISKRRGVKLFGGELAKPGNIIIRQKGTRVWPGNNVQLARDFTLMALVEGVVTFFTKKGKQYVSVVPQAPAK
jgi:large subunit ribosomal protein L27